MTMDSLVSVIIPTYNCGRWVEAAIDSALGQTYKNVEILVVDDGSTDGTGELLARYGDRIRYVRNDRNSGLAFTRNRGIRLARGRYIAILDADDEWLPNRLEIMLPYFDKYPPKTFLTSNAYLRIDGKLTDTTSSRNPSDLYNLDAQGQYVASLRRNFVFIMCIIDKAALDEVGLFDEQLRYDEDWDLWLRLFRAGYSVRYVDRPLAIYAVRRDSLTRQNNLRKAQNVLRIISKHRDQATRRDYQIPVGSVAYHQFRENPNPLLKAGYLLKALLNRHYFANVVWPSLLTRRK